MFVAAHDDPALDRDRRGPLRTPVQVSRGAGEQRRAGVAVDAHQLGAVDEPDDRVLCRRWWWRSGEVSR